MKKILIVLLSVLAILGFSTENFEASEIVSSGKCGDNLTWELSADGELVISGEGEMWDFKRSSGNVPSWYEYNYMVTSVTMKTGVVSIGTDFLCGFGWEYPKLEKVEVPETLNKIGSGAFDYCFALKEIDLSRTQIATVESFAFASCSSLEKVILPGTVEEIGESAFYKCNSLENFNMQNLKINKIGNYAFYSCKSLKNIVLPQTVESIGEYAFYECNSLESINLQDTQISYIADRVFEECKALSQIGIPKTAMGIGRYTFKGCKQLTYIDLPKSVKNIGEYAFAECDNMLDIIIRNKLCVFWQDSDDDRLPYATIHGYQNSTAKEYAEKYGYRFEPIIDNPNEKPAHTLVATGECGDNLVWEFFADGELVVSGEGAMWDYGDKEPSWLPYKEEILSVTIQSGVTAIGWDAFAYHEYIEHITFPDTLKNIRSHAFWHCTLLENFTLPEGLKSIGQQAFGCCDRITELIIPDTVSFIDVCIAQGCERLKYVYIGGSEGGYAYGNSPIQGGESLEWIEVSPNNPSLTSVDGVLYSKDKKKLVEYPKGRKDEVFVILDGTESVFNSAGENDFVKKIVFPTSLKYLSDYAFSDCKALEYIDLRNTQITSLPQWAFQGCSALKTVLLPETLKEIGVQAFSRCDELEYIDIPQSVEKIEFYSFGLCYKLKDVIIRNPQCEIADYEDTFHHTAAIHGFKNSTAQAYAAKYNRAFDFSVPGWQKNQTGWWYLNEDGTYPKDSWKQISGKWYAFDERGYMKEGWMRVGENWYYLQPGSGHMVSGWQYINNKLYYFASGGAMVTGWQYLDNTVYYFTSSGALAKGWQYMDGVWYYFNSNGGMTRGWLQQNGVWYYLNSDGSMATGWVDRNGTWYYFYSNGAMAVDTWIGDYYVNSSGAWVR